jgi:hypothetical protein
MSQQAKEILNNSIDRKKNSGAEYSKESVQDAVLEAMSEYADLKCKPLVEALGKIKIIAKRHGEIKDIIETALNQYREGEKIHTP